MNTARAIVLRVGAALTLAVLVLVPPVAIAALIGRPFPSWSTLTDEIDRGQVSTDTVMRIAAGLFIAIWIWIVATIATETFRVLNARHLTPARTAQTTAATARPTGHSMLHRLVRLALLGTVTTAATVSTWSTIAIATPPAGNIISPPAVTAPADPTWTVPSTPATTTIVADGRSTPLSIAVDLGDESLRDDIVAMNRSAAWTLGVFPTGMLVTIPTIQTRTTPNGIEQPATSRDALVVESYVVQPGDGLWNVAEAFLGDGSRHHELPLLLAGQQVAPGVVYTETTTVIHPGWIFQNPTVQPAAMPPTPATFSANYVVQAGDTLSGIAASKLGDEDRWRELWALNQHHTMPDGRTFNDADLIVPGWTLELPQTTTEPVDTDWATTNQPDPAAQPADITPPTPPLAEPAVTPDATTELVRPEPDQVSTSTADRAPVNIPTAPTTPTTTATSNGTLRPPTSESRAIEKHPSIWTTAKRSVWEQIAVGSLLTCGLALTIRRLRQRRLSQLQPGYRLVKPSDLAAGTEHSIITQTNPRSLSTINGLLRSITPYAAEHTDPLAVRAVQIGPERIELLFARPAPLPAQGWTTIDGGQSWTHRFDHDPPVNESHQLLTPALATIGIRSDRDPDEVLLDLETAGTLTLTGDRNAALCLARSIALELATYPLGVSMDVALIGVNVAGTELCDRVWLDTTIDRAVRVARHRADHNTKPITSARAELDTDNGANDPTVFIVDIANLDDNDRLFLGDLVRLCQPSTGTVAVLIGEHPDARENVTINADGTALWSGVELRIPNISPQAANEVAVTLDHAAHADAELIEPDELMTALLAPVDGTIGRDNASLADENDCGLFVYEPPPCDVMVQVMGEPKAHGADLTADETELLALLTCLRRRTAIHIGLIHDAVGGERARKTIENRMSRLRRNLGVGSDDLDLLPEAASGRGTQSHYLISPLVLTDVDLLEHRYHVADSLNSNDALAVLKDGLTLMQGPLFRARRGYEFWPHSEGVIADMTSIIQTFSTRLIELAADTGDTDLVIRTTSTCGRVLDNPLAEFPMRQAEQLYAQACGDDALHASVEAARKKLIEYIDDADNLADA